MIVNTIFLFEIVPEIFMCKTFVPYYLNYTLTSEIPFLMPKIDKDKTVLCLFSNSMSYRIFFLQ